MVFRSEELGKGILARVGSVGTPLVRLLPKQHLFLSLQDYSPRQGHVRKAQKTQDSSLCACMGVHPGLFTGTAFLCLILNGLLNLGQFESC